MDLILALELALAMDQALELALAMDLALELVLAMDLDLAQNTSRSPLLLLHSESHLTPSG